MQRTRRGLLLGAAAVATSAVAGCLGTSSTNSGSDDGDDTIQASFFVVSDFTSHVAAGRTVRNLVPFGQHGHGWEPGPDVQRDVLDADAFVYVGEGFQPWADKIVRNVRNDDADVRVIEAWEGIDLLGATEHDDGHDGHEEDHSDEGSHDGSENHEEGHDDGENHDGSANESHGDHDGHENSTAESHEGSQEESHDHGSKDPHFWLDPDRAKQSVDNIADGLAEMDPANESTYTENADGFKQRLTELDETYEERLSGRAKDTVLVAGHNSFRYLGERYDFHVEALTGLAPDAEPTPKDVRRAQSVIDEHDIEYILAPVFESDRAATQLVRETDATEALPLTPVPSLTEEWRAEGWGYVDVMENVNLPSLARALGAE
ncbi:metal ABC transporter substrate-binding protein [Halobium salinum]|uniref:Metal ABC transporter substrate-binding protein n=1 Tax=Halobium salinum TaxID=1364940 RepID=A0ABD5PCK8_9EURY|nr:zinc ABC transporter substrate-binding protein [Halobium salinum]